MKWEYTRILYPGNLTLSDGKPRSEKRRHGQQGKLENPDIADPVEDHLNELGEKGWELVSTTIVDGAQSSHFYTDRCIVEYLLKRPKP